MKLKTILIIPLLVISSLLLGFYLGKSLSNSIETIIEPGSMVTEASYIIFTDGTNYYARNGMRGSVISSPSFSELMTRVISQVKNGGLIFIKAGIYEGDIFITGKAIHLSGEGKWGTIIRGSIIFNATLTGKEHTDVQGSFIEHLTLDGEGLRERGIVYEAPSPTVSLITIQDVNVENFIDRGISFENASDTWFNRVIVGNCPIGIYYTTQKNFGRITNSQILNYATQGLFTDAEILLSGNVFSAISTAPSVGDVVLSHPSGAVGGAKIIGNWFEHDSATPNILVVSKAYRPILIVGNFFANHGGDMIVGNVDTVTSTLKADGNFFSQVAGTPSEAIAIHMKSGTLEWGANTIDTAFSILPYKLDEGTYMASTSEVDYKNLSAIMSRLIATEHPDTSNWGMTEKGRIWFCVTHGCFEYWNGTDVITIGCVDNIS